MNILPSFLTRTNKNNETNVINAIANRANTDENTVRIVLEASYQLTQNANDELMQKQEDLYNYLKTQNQTNQSNIQKLANGLNEVNNKQKITNIHLKELQEEITNKAKKAAKGTNQMDSDDILFGNLTMEEVLKRQEDQAKETKHYKKIVAKYKRRIWYLIKLHMNDIYGTSKAKRKEDFQDYMFHEIQDYIKNISVYEVRQSNK
ncbi:hypothetical protein BUZ43_00645 [Staphylococcus haemolyticus]|uniref:hypothetical protein n=1 Tax=Staphylococcus haemolyticus TaxID=1283 RepID=UPI000D1DB2BE|nr:hypothetical protein [Staphylococcus haemolyticus]PTK51074.1 hypothetical protein BUZ43_00645 [Staphylococcus haemolyticus]